MNDRADALTRATRELSLSSPFLTVHTHSDIYAGFKESGDNLNPLVEEG